MPEGIEVAGAGWELGGGLAPAERNQVRREGNIARIKAPAYYVNAQVRTSANCNCYGKRSPTPN